MRRREQRRGHPAHRMPQHEWPLQPQRLNQRRDVRDKQWIRDTLEPSRSERPWPRASGITTSYSASSSRATRSQVIPPAMMPCSKTSAGLPLPIRPSESIAGASRWRRPRPQSSVGNQRVERAIASHRLHLLVRHPPCGDMELLLYTTRLRSDPLSVMLPL